ncbi:MAG: MFS transporter, partial [Chloroflexota bacterium]
MLTPSLWRHADFLKLWTGQTVSRLGSVVTRTALPLVALLVLGAGPREMAYLVISASLGVLLVGLVAGAWVDRLRRKPILVWTDVIRAALLFWVPTAYAIGALRIEQLYAVAFIEACLASLFNAAYPAYVPSLIGTERVVDANSKLATSTSIAEIGGPGLAGTLVQIGGAPFAILVDAFSFVVSAVSLAIIRTPEPPRPARETTTRIVSEIVEGLSAVRRHPVVFPLALRSVLGHVFGSFYGVLYSLYLLQDLHLDPFLLGVVIS